jgi:hypothetical protein
LLRFFALLNSTTTRSFTISFLIPSSHIQFYFNFASHQLELCELYPFAGGNYAEFRAIFGRFPAFMIGCLDVLQYAFMTFLAIGYSGITLCDLLAINQTVFCPLFICAVYSIFGVALASTFQLLPAAFGGLSILLVLLYLAFVLCTASQMDSDKWLNNYDSDAAIPSFGLQFLSSLDFTLLLTQGLSTAFLFCDKTAEVRY